MSTSCRTTSACSVAPWSAPSLPSQVHCRNAPAVPGCRHSCDVQERAARAKPECPACRRPRQGSQLKSDVAEILEIPFPEIGVEPRAWDATPLTGSGRWVSAAALARAHAAPRSRAHRRPRPAGPSRGKDCQRGRCRDGRAAAARKAYEEELAATGTKLIDAATKALERAGAADVGLCASAAPLGGCSGPMPRLR